MSTTSIPTPARNGASARRAPARSAAPSGEERPGESAGSERARVYTGRSLEELIPQIEQELGEDAIVTRRRSGLGGGVAGFFQRPFVEIEARPGHPRVDLYDEPTPALGRFAAALADAQTAEPEPELPVAEQRLAQPVAAPDLTQRAEAPAPARALARPAASPAPLSADASSALHKPTRLREIATEATPAPLVVPPRVALPEAAAAPAEQRPLIVSAPSYAAAPAATARHREPVAPVHGHEPPAAAEIRAKLLARGIEQSFADELIAQACAHAQALMPARASFADAVASVLRARIPAPAPWSADGTTVALVGPGGAGKTSFCAALANSYRASSTLPVACATILSPSDGARRYELLLSPQLLAPTAVADQRACRALEDAREAGVLLLDTPSAPIGARAEINRLAKLLKQLAPDHVVLALPATFGARAAEQLLEALRPLRVDSLAITHAHETDQLGAAVQTACLAGVAPAFLLDQRRGGAGLRHTDPSDLAERLLG